MVHSTDPSMPRGLGAPILGAVENPAELSQPPLSTVLPHSWTVSILSSASVDAGSTNLG